MLYSGSVIYQYSKCHLINIPYHEGCYYYEEYHNWSSQFCIFYGHVTPVNDLHWFVHSLEPYR